MAAAWICGEFSDVLTSIMLDLKSDEESEDDEDEEDQGYWIEGPEGDEIRSKWRGKPLVVMTIACLLHPRSTNLPARVQSAFIHAAMKIFIRACDGRCSHEHVSQMLALLRTRLPVYLQSVHLEVQERASTLRYLLAETGILAVDAGLVYDGQLSSKIDENGDLLTFKDLEPVDGDDIELTQIRVLSVDISGASAALKAFSYLKSIVSEEFFGVHPKAQRKVQIPDGLDLNTAFNKKAVDDLLSDDRQEEYNISTISFIKASEGPLSSFPQPAKEISTTWTSKEETKSKDFYSENYSQNRYEAPPSYSANEKPPSHGTTDQTFYLHRNRLETDEEESNQEHFADGFQPVDHTETRRKKKSKKSSRKTGK